MHTAGCHLGHVRCLFGSAINNSCCHSGQQQKRQRATSWVRGVVCSSQLLAAFSCDCTCTVVISVTSAFILTFYKCRNNNKNKCVQEKSLQKAKKTEESA